MAFKCNCAIKFKQVQLIDAHVIISGYQELNKDTMIVNTRIFRNKQDYLNHMPALDDFRHLVPVTALASAANFRTGIYTWLMTQPEYTNPVADMSNDFPVTPI